jgi:hypothetical protein
MELRYQQVQKVFFRMYDVESDKEKAFESRLNNFRLFKIPQGIQVGQGKVAKYGWQQMLQLAVAIELAHLGMHPREIRPFCHKFVWQAINDGFQMAASARGDRLFLVFDSPRMMPASGEVMSGLMSVMNATQVFQEVLLKSNSDHRRYILLDLTGILERLEEAIESEVGEKIVRK